ncbi:hypothetical protein FF38_03861 [Lucilia cuprina]|uniref:Protein commissureless n=1 Tax=Lucilia cuprina TaxID=7375 RepID=A0A0L0CMK5_LUCCU|nr:hypothetical protein CVS40_2864 [Lucilia cuprina]KAI8127095.1 hypothetical protein CVS40_2864 [Lucilia cuprina]KNC33535.1 hypothetical protein FF38_03861 [Lucilia cuprina]
MWAAKKCNSFNSVWLIITVVTVLLPLTQGQAYHFIIGHHQRNFDQLYREPNSRTYVADTNYSDTTAADLENTNSTIIVTTVRESNELSQTAMDIITIVWYVATFLALAAFFLLMACSDRRCSDTQRNANMNTNEAPIPPPTPSPSYSEFAPPSYDSVMKLQHQSKNTIFVIPFSVEPTAAKDGVNTSVNNQVNTTTTTTTTNTNANDLPLTPNMSFYTINELQKLGS